MMEFPIISQIRRVSDFAKSPAHVLSRQEYNALAQELFNLDYSLRARYLTADAMPVIKTLYGVNIIISGE